MALVLNVVPLRIITLWTICVCPRLTIQPVNLNTERLKPKVLGSILVSRCVRDEVPEDNDPRTKLDKIRNEEVRMEAGIKTSLLGRVSTSRLGWMGATCFVQPLDLVKNRMQLSGMGGKQREYKTSFHAFQGILRSEGIVAMYSGLSAGLLRQATYTTTRLGIYTWLFEKFSGKDGHPPGFFVKAGLGMAAGVCGAFVGTPAEVALIRMTADGRLPAAERRNYKNVAEALFRITREEGVLTLWRGAVPTMGRAMVVNAAQLASYSQAKEFLLTTGTVTDNTNCLYIFKTKIMSPIFKKIQNMKIVDGKPEFTGAADVLKKVIQNEGFFSLWKGFTPYYARLGPHTVLTFIFLEQMNIAYNVYILGNKNAKGGL
uniref:Mitochondrial 2-oxoglutarate/malate carrier protein n=1 Tax=Timema tahoe TaxID=61484 RepID=A0A7R9IL02_9NEOP|nr:unnamed protein product [Timema tahoe]